MKRIRKTLSTLNLPTLRLEGALFLPDVLEKAALGTARLQTEADYGIPKGLKLKDEYSRAFQIASALWKHFAPQMDRADLDAAHATASFVTELLRTALAYPVVGASTGITVGERHYPVTHIASNGQGAQLPIVMAPHSLGLDDADPRYGVRHADGSASGQRKKSPFQLMQELLNASHDHQWGLVTNGKTIRLLRDAATLTRPSYLDVDLADLLSGQRYAEFAYAWRLLHASRAGLQATSDGQAHAPVAWEAWREAGQEEGTRVRNGLRLGVTQALLSFGNGFVQHPANASLREALHTGQLSQADYFAQLLRLIYRLIFVFSVEERGLLPTNAAYAQGYALARLRDMALRRRAKNRFDDLWQSLRIVFKGLSHGEPRLGLPALGGLFANSQCPALDAAELTNADLLTAMQHLRWAAQPGGSLAPIDYRNMGVEELGSVYESLLELVPQIDVAARSFGFVGLTSEGSTAGNERKLTGSYYTPDSLVQELIQSALVPVIDQRIVAQPDNPVEALLSIKVCDPACGSGHFLLAAARKLAERLAALRSDDGVVTPAAYRHALREVIARCIYGVDRNPMAIELARTALWLEGFEEGRPLSFLDHHLQVGDALLGLTDLKALEFGIAKDAFKPLSGDDKNVCKQLAKVNAAALKDLEKKRKANAFGQLDVASIQDSGLGQLQALEALPETSTQEIAAKEAAYRAFLEQAKTSRLAHAADLLVGAYLLTKGEGAEAHIPTSATLYLTLLGDALPTDQQGALAVAQTACAEARVLHWPLAFPQVFAGGGFDCVLGNPPWEHVELKEEEFFSNRNPLVAAARNKAERNQRIQWLSEGMLVKHLFPQSEISTEICEVEKRLYSEFIAARRVFEASSNFAHVDKDDGGRFPLTGVGRVNTYALFSETIKQLISPFGRAGFIVPSGLATDNSTKEFFGEIVSKKLLDSFFEFENEGFFHGAGQGHMLRFALTTIVGAAQKIEAARFLFQGKSLDHLIDSERVFTLTPDEISLLNPNTLTCPIFQSRYDSELAKKIYSRVSVLIREGAKSSSEINPWNIKFSQGTHNMSTDSHRFKSHRELVDDGFHYFENIFSKGLDEYIPLYESKMMQIYNHRHGDFLDSNHERAHILPRIPVERLGNKNYKTTPYYWVKRSDVEDQIKEFGWPHKWFLTWRNITDSRASARTLITAAIPFAGVGNSLPIYLPLGKSATDSALLLANMSSLILDYLARMKVGGLNFNYFIFKQLPVFTPERYNDDDKSFILPRVLELTCNAEDMRNFLEDISPGGEIICFDESKRATAQAELDAYFAKLYGLNREELQFVLDPNSVKPGYPSETFAVLKRNEEREFGEYRTQRLVLEAWDKLERGELH